MPYLILPCHAQLVLWAAVAALAFFLLEERPANSPSAAAAMQWAAREKEQLDSKVLSAPGCRIALRSTPQEPRAPRAPRAHVLPVAMLSPLKCLTLTCSLSMRLRTG